MKRKVVGYREVRAHTSLALLRIDSLVLLRAQCIALIHGTAALRLHPTDEARDKVPSPQTPEIITVGTPPPRPNPRGSHHLDSKSNALPTELIPLNLAFENGQFSPLPQNDIHYGVAASPNI